MFRSRTDEGSKAFDEATVDVSDVEFDKGTGSILFKGRRTDLDQLILKPEIKLKLSNITNNNTACRIDSKFYLPL